MNQINTWEARLDYLVVRHTYEHKRGSGHREREQSARVHFSSQHWDDLDRNLRVYPIFISPSLWY